MAKFVPQTMKGILGQIVEGIGAVGFAQEEAKTTRKEVIET